MRLTETVGSVVANEICRLPLLNENVGDQCQFLGAELVVYSVQKAYMLLTVLLRGLVTPSTRNGSDDFPVLRE